MQAGPCLSEHSYSYYFLEVKQRKQIIIPYLSSPLQGFAGILCKYIRGCNGAAEYANIIGFVESVENSWRNLIDGEGVELHLLVERFGQANQIFGRYILLSLGFSGLAR
jgi:hypothetical protein